MQRHNLILMLTVLSISCGCAPRQPIFPAVNPPVVWPAPPESPRIRYVGQLTTSADLKPSVSPFEGLGAALFGKNPIHSMLTPYAVCTDVHNRLFVADSNAQVIHVFDLSTRKYERWQLDRKNLFAQPVGVAYDTVNDRLI